MPLPKTKDDLIAAGWIYSRTANCSGCAAIVEWWVTPAGKKMPADPMYTGDALFTSHFATCPEAARFRRKTMTETCPLCGSSNAAYRGNIYVPDNKIECYHSFHDSSLQGAEGQDTQEKKS